MIPFAILSGRLTFSDHASLSFRVLDLSAAGFTFRLSKKYDGCEISAITLNFYNYETDGFDTCPLSDFTVIRENPEPITDFEDFYTFYRIKTVQADYAVHANRLTTFYMHYIELKLFGDDADLSEALTGYPAALESEFPKDMEDFRRIHFDAVNSDMTAVLRQAAIAKETALSLMTSSLIEDFIAMPFDVFSARIEKQYYHGAISIDPQKITHLYLGHPGDFKLYPDASLLLKATEKAVTLNLLPVIVIPPLRGKQLDDMKLLISLCLPSLFPAYDASGRHPECLINDWGIASWLHAKYGNRCRLILGTLLNKRRKDVRLPYKHQYVRLMTLLCENTSNDTFYQKTLAADFGIEHFAYDAAGYLQTIPEGRHELHLPYYMMNTGGFEAPSIRCYPSFLPMIGIDGILWGLDTRLFKDPAYQQTLQSLNIHRIVLEVI